MNNHKYLTRYKIEYFHCSNIKLEILYRQKQEVEDDEAKIQGELDRQTGKLERAETFYKKNLDQVKRKEIFDLEDTSQIALANLEHQKNLTKAFFSVIQYIFKFTI